MKYITSFQQGLEFLQDQRAVFELTVRALLDTVSKEVSKMLLNEVVFQWHGDVLRVYCPRTGVARDFTHLTILDHRDDSGRWSPVVCLRALGAGRGVGWELKSISHLEEALAGMLAVPEVARSIAIVGGLGFADLVLPLSEEAGG